MRGRCQRHAKLEMLSRSGVDGQELGEGEDGLDGGICHAGTEPAQGEAQLS